MNRKFSILFFVVTAFPVICIGEESANPVGVGVGAFYNGIGVSYRTKNEDYYNYYSVGCPSLGYGESSGFITNCGVGYSFLTSNLVKNKHHGIVGNVGVNYANNGTNSAIIYIAGISYAYFFSGVENSGWNIQVGPISEYSKGTFGLMGVFGFGYQY